MAKVGDYNMTSDRSGFVYPRSEMRQEWTGRWVHYSEWEPQQPQEIITPKKDNQRVWPVRDEQPVVMVSTSAESSGPVTFVSADSGLLIASNGYSVESISGASNLLTRSDAVTPSSSLQGVRFTIDKSQFADNDVILVGFIDGQTIAKSTKDLSVYLKYDQGTDNIIIEALGSILTTNYDTPAVSHTYTSGSQICIAITSLGVVTCVIGGVTYSYTPSPAITGLNYFGTIFFTASAGVVVNISQEANIFTGITDFSMNTTPYIPPSQLDNY